MVQVGQIVPMYTHPHVATYLNDNTVVQDTVASVQNGLHGIFVFTSPKGRDGVLLEMSSQSEYISEYGRPNFKLYGQPGYMPWKFLSGLTQAWCMRVMPENATFANAIVVAKVKVETTGVAPAPVVKNLLVRFEVVNQTNVLDAQELLPLAELLEKEDPDAEGFSVYPLFAVRSQGRGAYGNAFRFRLQTSAQADKENRYKNYSLEVHEVENSLVRKEAFTVTFDPDSVSGTTSLYAPDVVNDDEIGSTRLQIEVIQSSIEALYNLYKTVDPTTAVELEAFDFVYGKNKETGANLPGFKLDSAHADFVSLDSVNGIPLESGDDGSFKESTDPTVREEAIATAYQKAFSGQFDRTILSKNRAPAEFIFDAGYPAEVKTDLIKLIVKRYDAKGFIDAGIINTLTDAVTWGETMKGYADRVFSKEFHHYKTRDPFTGKIIPVTITYFYAEVLPQHYVNVGNHIPFVGEQYAMLRGHIKNSLLPVVDADDMEYKEQLYNLRLNYFQAVRKNVFVRGTQSTSQTALSDLSEENNMYVLLQMKREIEALVSSLAYNFAEKADRARFKQDGERILEPYTGNRVREVTIDFEMTPYEELRSILHCYVGVTFRTMGKRGIIEIDINPRA